MYQEVLDEVRGDIAHAGTPGLQLHLSNILTAMSQMHLSQYDSQNTNRAEGDRAKGDKSKCTVANALLEEALSIQRAHTQYGLAAQTLTLLASSHGNLEMFDEARSTLKEAINLSSCCDGKESTTVASCHNRMASICHAQATAIRAQSEIHVQYMLTNSMRNHHGRGRRVLVEGLQKQQ